VDTSASPTLPVKTWYCHDQAHPDYQLIWDDASKQRGFVNVAPPPGKVVDPTFVARAYDATMPGPNSVRQTLWFQGTTNRCWAYWAARDQPNQLEEDPCEWWAPHDQG
jgi:hypothetical protein